MAKHRSRDIDLDDEPTYEPMRGVDPTVARRAPSTDQRRIRRQMARTQEQRMTQKTGSDTSISPHREAELLRMMAAASTLADQRAIAAELESFRAKRTEEQRRAASLDLSTQLPTSRVAHRAENQVTSMASDWLMDVEAPEHTAVERDRHMVAEASMWFTARPEDVRSDHEEFTVQAIGLSARLASQYGEDAAAAQRSFLDHVGHLAGFNLLATDEMTMPTNDSQVAPPVETEPMDTINAPADTGPAEVENSTPAGDASLSEGDQPEGDHAGEVAPVPQSASENDASAPGTFPGIDNKPFTTWKGSSQEIGGKRRAAAARQAALRVEAVAWGRRHYEDLASMISNHPEREKLAKHFADHLTGTNPNYRRDQFQQAASTKGYQVRGGTGTAAYSRGHYQHVANALASYPGNRDSVAKSFADHFASTNPRFNRDTFLKATKAMSAPKAAAYGYGEDEDYSDAPSTSDDFNDYGAPQDQGPIVDGQDGPPPGESVWGPQGPPDFSQDDQDQMNQGAILGAAAAPASYRFEVNMKHPSGTNHTEIVTAPSPEEAISSTRSKFDEGSGTEHADWSAKRLMESSKQAALPTEDGLNAGVDFDPIEDPIDSMSLGDDDEGDWPDAPSGVQASLYDALTDRRVASADHRHELAIVSSRTGWIFVDADLDPIPAEISREAYVAQPVRKVYLGIDQA